MHIILDALIALGFCAGLLFLPFMISTLFGV